MRSALEFHRAFVSLCDNNASYADHLAALQLLLCKEELDEVLTEWHRHHPSWWTLYHEASARLTDEIPF